MKKIAALLLCLVMLCGAGAFAEEGDIALGTIGNAKAAYSVTCKSPGKYTVFHKQADHQSLEGMLANDSTKGMSYLFVITLDEEAAGIESLAALDEEAMKQRVAAYEEEGLAVTEKEQGGMKFMLLAEKGAKKNTFLSIETILHGCLIQISASPVEDAVSAMNEKQARTAMDFLATLAFAPAEPFPEEETEEEAEPVEADETVEEPAEEDAKEEEPAAEPPMIVGGWSVSGEPIVSRLSEEEQNIFDKVVALTGLDYEPAAVVATQVVAGTNYAYLCRERDGDREWIIVTIYGSLNGEAQILNAHELSLYNLLITDKAMPVGLSGGWSLREADSGAALPEEAQAAFSKAVSAAGETLRPIVLLGTQVVAGTNYKVLAQGEDALYIVEVYQPLTGEATVTETQMLDLLSYVSVN